MEVVWLVDFDLPAIRIGRDGSGSGGLGTGDEQGFAVLQAQRRKMDEASPHRPASGQEVDRAGLRGAEQHIGPHEAVPGVGDRGVALEALVGRDVLFL